VSEGRVVIRPAKREDIDKIHRIEVLSFKDPYSRSLLTFYLSVAGERGFLVAEVDGRVVGYIIGVRTRGICHIISIAVHPNWRRKGIGHVLLSELIKSFAFRGVNTFTLEVRASNKAAINFYVKHGFVQSGVIRNYYPDGEDAIIMVLRNVETPPPTHG